MSNEFKLVPVEPNDEMLQVGCDSYFDSESSVWTAMADAYKAMLAAAPQPSALGGETEALGVAAYVNQCNGQFVLKRELDTDNFPEFWDKLVFLKDASALFAPLQAEIERWKACYEEASDKHSVAYAEANKLADQIDQLKARRDELEGLLRIVRGKLSFGPDDVISIDAALSKTAGSEQ
ncbi:hypothetical protein QIT81_gp26 [Pseudomonas phage MR15]|uniref:Uncharacterized protein n=1 Tax=Pseudomonas phage MR15 TaxID=2711179 RepID=A0A6M3TDX1_9CAUD|nr:hypothetical protein QIT81_gp26 [Pseudomonas phage MR15]QJD55088.1 hypothetical protein Psm1vBMR13_gp26c [Pseudomonas phage MR13]QJD55240.1 hypothetical protein Psm1vBMR15_gp26c [Pseudomonas phage MR15]